MSNKPDSSGSKQGGPAYRQRLAQILPEPETGNRDVRPRLTKQIHIEGVPPQSMPPSRHGKYGRDAELAEQAEERRFELPPVSWQLLLRNFAICAVFYTIIFVNLKLDVKPGLEHLPDVNKALQYASLAFVILLAWGQSVLEEYLRRSPAQRRRQWPRD